MFSFDLPSAAPLRLGVRYQPSAQEYFSHPGPGGFKAGLFKPPRWAGRDDRPGQNPTLTQMPLQQSRKKHCSIRSLVITSYAFQYGAILLDLPSGESAWTMQPLLAASTVMIVSRPTLDGVRATAHVARLLTEYLHSDHRLPQREYIRGLEPAHKTVLLYSFKLSPGRGELCRLVSTCPGDN